MPSIVRKLKFVVTLISVSFFLLFFLKVFQQIPGTLLVRGSLKDRERPGPGFHLPLYQFLLKMHILYNDKERILDNWFCRELL